MSSQCLQIGRDSIKINQVILGVHFFHQEVKDTEIVIVCFTYTKKVANASFQFMNFRFLFNCFGKNELRSTTHSDGQSRNRHRSTVGGLGATTQALSLAGVRSSDLIHLT